MCLKIVVGAIKKGPKSTDSVDRDILKSTLYDVKSHSARDFYNGIKAIVEACEKKKKNPPGAGGQDQDAPPEKGLKKAEAPACCCIKTLVLDGHSTAALGGGQNFDQLTAAQKADLEKWMCKPAEIQMFGCQAFNIKRFNNHPGYRLHLQMAQLVGRKGGKYTGFKGDTSGDYPDISADGEDKPTSVNIPEGATEKQIKDLFKGVDPKGQ